MNPGIDLLMAVNWDDALSGKMAVDNALPPLTGLMPMAAMATGTNASAVPQVQAPAVQEKGNLIRNVAEVLGGGVIVVLGCAFFLWRKRQ
jgi:hypothetical protein